MTATVVIGMQWGDEGKGKVVDLLCSVFDAVVRFQGGNNAGHTVKFGDRHYALHLLPSGILQRDKLCVLANGMVIPPGDLLAEIQALGKVGVDCEGRLFLSRRAHAILPLHVELDRARESRRGSGKIGTTVKGIGPAYESKAARCGLRLGELGGADLDSRLAELAEPIEAEIARLGGEAPDRAEVAASCRRWAAALEPMMRNTEYLLDSWLDRGKSLLFEGAQGTLLDLDLGTYPYVTSSSASAGGAATGSGVPPSRLDGVVGVIKAYTTRVGGGPFPTELSDEVGGFLQQRGHEVGTTTGRPRRCGWLDAVAARHSRMTNGVDILALTKLDVLDTLDEICICTGYRSGGEVVDELPPTAAGIAAVEPVYRTLPGWKESTVGMLTEDGLPDRARDYLAAVEEEVGAPVGLLSTGPRREETLVRDIPALHRLTGGKLDEIRAHRDSA